MLIYKEHVDEATLHNVSKLFERCKQHDGNTIPYYPELLAHPRAKPASLMIYNHQEIIAFAAVFFFDANAGEIVLCVAPEERRRHLATRLLETLLSLIQKERPVSHLNFSVSTPFLTQRLQQYGFVCTDGEYDMELSLETPSPPSTNLSIRPATAADIPSLCELDAQCFPHSFTFSAERFLDLLQDEQYRVFVMKNEQHLIGKAHLAFKPNHTTRLSDVAIHPAWQRQGHGRSLVTQCLHYARNLYPNAPITLNVNAKNQHAIALYQDIGFARTNTVDYWTQSSQILQAHLRQRR